MSAFLSPTSTSLKICGITSASDAYALADLGVHALGINFWPQSKRYCHPDLARTFLPDLAGKTLRIGVFVNNARSLAEDLFSEGLLDLVQLHGDETAEDLSFFLEQDIPVIRALPATADFATALDHVQPSALLIDTPAGADYGGTGQTFDWSRALEVKNSYPDLPLILAGGLHPGNALSAVELVRPAAIDIASGAEISPGIKDLEKSRQLLEIVNFS